MKTIYLILFAIVAILSSYFIGHRQGKLDAIDQAAEKKYKNTIDSMNLAIQKSEEREANNLILINKFSALIIKDSLRIIDDSKQVNQIHAYYKNKYAILPTVSDTVLDQIIRSGIVKRRQADNR